MGQNGSKTRSSKSDPAPSRAHKQVKGAYFEPVLSHFGPFKVPQTLENGPFCEQKWVKKSTFAKMIPEHFEPGLTQLSPFRYM